MILSNLFKDSLFPFNTTYTKICSNCARTLEEGAIVERDKLEAEKKELEGRANFLLFTQEQLRSQVS